MKKRYLSCAILTGVTLAFTGCVDSNYDLSDLDTTTEIKINDLTVPVNLSSIKLTNIIDLDTIDPNASLIAWPKNPGPGEKQIYAIYKKGDFHSEKIEIPAIDAPKPEIEPIDKTISIAIPESARHRAPGEGVDYVIDDDNTPFTYEAHDIDTAVESIDAIGIRPLNLAIYFHSNAVKTLAKEVYFKNINITLPKGLTLTCSADNYTYNPATGILYVELLHSTGNEANLSVIITDINDFGAMGGKIQGHDFYIESNLGIENGILEVVPQDPSLITQLPSEIDFKMEFDLDPLSVTSFTGNVRYNVDDLNIDPISITGIPDFLQGEQTDIIINNPQLYLTVNNPAAPYGVKCTTGLAVSKYRHNEWTDLPPMSKLIELGTAKGEGPYNIFISSLGIDHATLPVNKNEWSDYPYPQLSNILSGAGLPEQIKIDLTPNPVMSGHATALPIGSAMSDVIGNYEFFSPLAVDPSSIFVYTGEDSGWYDDDMSKLEITQMRVKAKATTDLPFSVEVRIEPLVFDPSTGENRVFSESAETAGTTIPAMAQGTEFEVVITCVDDKGNPLTNLDGIRYAAYVRSENSSEALSPEQFIQLDDVRATVSGKYTTDF